MGLKLIRKVIEPKRIPYPEDPDVAIRIRPMIRSCLVMDQETGMPDVAPSLKRQFVYCLTEIEGIRFDDADGKAIPFNDELKGHIFDRPQDIGFPMGLLAWIQEQINEISDLESLRKNWESSQGGDMTGSPAGAAETSPGPKDDNQPVENAVDTK